MREGYGVLIIDMARYDPAEDYVVGPFPTYELAKEFARRWVRDSVEELRGASPSPSELSKRWRTFGEDAVVLGGGRRYAGSHELDFFVARPANAEERDWKAIKRLAGLE